MALVSSHSEDHLPAMGTMNENTLPVLSRRDIEALIAQGRKLFILDDFVIKADAWIPYHPGGGKSILHLVGRDATDEVTALVSRVSPLPYRIRARTPLSTHLLGNTERLLTCLACQSSLDRGKTTYEPLPHRDHSRQMGELHPAHSRWHVSRSL